MSIIEGGLVIILISSSFYAGMKWERFCQNLNKL